MLHKGKPVDFQPVDFYLHDTEMNLTDDLLVSYRKNCC